MFLQTKEFIAKIKNYVKHVLSDKIEKVQVSFSKHFAWKKSVLFPYAISEGYPNLMTSTVQSQVLA